MKYVLKKMGAYGCVMSMALTMVQPVYASTEVKIPYEQMGVAVENDLPTTMTLTVDEAINYAIEHNTTIKLIGNKIALAEMTYYEAVDNAGDLSDADEKLDDATDLLNSKSNEFNSNETNLSAAEVAINNDIAPEAITLLKDNGEVFINPMTGEAVVISAGQPIKATIEALLQQLYVGALGASPDPADVEATEAYDKLKAEVLDKAETDAKVYDQKIVALAKEKLAPQRMLLEQKRVELAEGKALIALKESDMNAKLEQISTSVESEIAYSSVITHTYENANKLMINMAGMNMNVTRYAKNIYYNQIAMLIQKNYYDVLLAEKAYNLKVKAEERGAKQYALIKLSYDNGMKSRDDMLLSQMYYQGTQVARLLANATYKNSITELKRNLNLNQKCELILEGEMLIDQSPENLEAGIQSGLTKRIEVQKSLGYLMIYELNEDILDKRYGNGVETRAKNEATILRRSAEIELEETNNTVEAQIRQSYELLIATEEMMLVTENLISEAQEVLSIAELKYDQGFGADNALLTNLNLSASSGTIIEVIAAQENLEEMETKVAQIQYNYIMAKVKYRNDAGLINMIE